MREQREDLRGQIEGLREETKGWIKNLQEQIRERIENLQTQMREQVRGLQAQVSSNTEQIRMLQTIMENLRNEIRSNFRWTMGLIITMWVTLILALIFK